VGNSSSGLLEVPSFRKGTINIGDRQRGRLQASSVINCEANQKSISSGIEMLYEPEFQLNLSQVRNPYGEEGASDKIVDILKTISIKNIVKKTFHDLTNLNIGHNK
jgi:GDP/UDP-N,N'-diacetylbacillosamine 2-epimerase (hydrolysing)